MTFDEWFKQICAEDENPAGLWKVEKVMREAWNAGYDAALPHVPIYPPIVDDIEIVMNQETGEAQQVRRCRPFVVLGA